MRIFYSTLRNCCFGRDEEKENIKEEKEENQYNLDYIDNLEYGNAIKYYILNNVHRQF